MPFKDPEKRKEYARLAMQKWRARNPEKAKEVGKKYSAAFREKNPSVVLKTNRNWYAKNKEQAKVAQKARTARWLESNPEGQARNYARWRKRHPEKVKELYNRYRGRKNKAGGKYTVDQIAARIVLFGSRCAYCGAAYQHLDHVIPLARGGTNWPANLRPACRRCNSRKSDKDWREWKVSF